MKFQIESPPDELSDKVRSYLRRQFEAVDVAIVKDPLLTPTKKYIPSIQKEGTIVYFSISIPDTPITAPGLYFIDATTIHRLIPVDLIAAGAAAAVHTHTIAQITGLQTALNGINSRLDNIEQDIIGINIRLDNIEGQLP